MTNTIATDKNKYNIIAYVIAFSFCGFITFQFIPRIANTGLLYYFEILMFTVAIVFSVLFNRVDTTLRFQLLWLALIIWMIWVLALYKWQGGVNPDNPLIIVGIISLSLLLLRYAIDLVLNRYEIFGVISDNIGFIVIAIICIALSIPTLNDIALYDSYAYTLRTSERVCAVNFNYAFTNIRDYCLCGHTTNGFVLFVLWGELVNSSYGLRIANILLYSISIVCFGRTLCKLCEKSNRAHILLGTMVYAFSPWTLGLIGQTSIDNPSLYLAVILIYAYVTDKNLLLLLIGWIFCNTKESNVIYYSAFVFVIWVQQVIYYLRYSDGLVSIKKKIVCLTLRGIYLIIPSVSWLIIYKHLTIDGSWLTSVVDYAPNQSVTVGGVEQA